MIYCRATFSDTRLLSPLALVQLLPVIKKTVLREKKIFSAFFSSFIALWPSQEFYLRPHEAHVTDGEEPLDHGLMTSRIQGFFRPITGLRGKFPLIIGLRKTWKNPSCIPRVNMKFANLPPFKICPFSSSSWAQMLKK